MKELNNVLKADTPRRIYYLKNREHIIKQHRDYNKKRREKIKIYGKLWRKKNKKRVRKMNKKRNFYDRVVMVLELGGKCKMCNYHENIGILIIHHLKGKENHNQNTKEFRIWKQTGKLPKNVVLLCPNCHAIEHQEKGYKHYLEWSSDDK